VSSACAETLSDRHSGAPAGRARIHSHDREYGFRARRFASPRNDEGWNRFPFRSDPPCNNRADMTAHARSAVRPSDAAACRPRKIERAQGRPGACRPHGPRAVKNARGRNHRFGRDIPALPARMGYGLYALSPGTGVLAPVAHNARRKHRELDTSSGVSGPHDFTVRFNAVRPSASMRPSQPASTFVTTRTPLFDEAGWRSEPRFLKKRNRNF
jgi:hypothetical protein